MNTMGGPWLETDSWSWYASGTTRFAEVENARLLSVLRAAWLRITMADGMRPVSNLC